LADGRAKGKGEILIRTDQRIANQKDPSQMVTEVIQLKTIEGSKDVSDADKRSTSKGTAWQKMSICTKRKKQKKT